MSVQGTLKKLLTRAKNTLSVLVVPVLVGNVLQGVRNEQELTELRRQHLRATICRISTIFGRFLGEQPLKFNSVVA